MQSFFVASEMSEYVVELSKQVSLTVYCLISNLKACEENKSQEANLSVGFVESLRNGRISSNRPNCAADIISFCSRQPL